MSMSLERTIREVETNLKTCIARFRFKNGYFAPVFSKDAGDVPTQARFPHRRPLVVKNGSKIRDLTASGIPEPLSRISTRMSVGSCLVRTFSYRLQA